MTLKPLTKNTIINNPDNEIEPELRIPVKGQEMKSKRVIKDNWFSVYIIYVYIYERRCVPVVNLGFRSFYCDFNCHLGRKMAEILYRTFSKGMGEV